MLRQLFCFGIVSRGPAACTWRVPRRRAGEELRWTGYHECSAERASESFPPPLVLCAGQQLRAGGDGEVRTTLRQVLRFRVAFQVPAAPTWQEAVMQGS